MFSVSSLTKNPTIKYGSLLSSKLRLSSIDLSCHHHSDYQLWISRFINTKTINSTELLLFDMRSAQYCAVSLVFGVVDRMKRNYNSVVLPAT